MNNSNFKFARLCSVTLCGMNSGWVINEGDFYIKDEAVALEFAKGHGWASIQELHDHDPDNFYYTEWEGVDEIASFCGVQPDEWYESPYEDGREAVLVSAE